MIEESSKFLGYDYGIDQAQILILPIPYEQTVSYRPGTREGPRAIITASQELETYDEELEQETYQLGIHTLEKFGPIMSGPKEMIASVQKKASELLKPGKFLVTLGGEHSLSFGLVKAFREKHPSLSVLQLDAHADLRDSYQGTPFSHASVMSRIQEIVPTVQVGIRSLSLEESRLIKERQLPVYFARDIRRGDDWMEKAIERLSPQIYLTIDLDVLDPSIMPSVSNPEPGGFSWEDLLRFLRLLNTRREIIGFDIMELAPIPGNIAPDFLAAKLTYRLLGYIFSNKIK
ncbi:MAG: agmatinase [Deltaproteobacteria bacterium]|nr:MAG: agmatinase [Deltaproteobacteria bacterium]